MDEKMINSKREFNSYPTPKTKDVRESCGDNLYVRFYPSGKKTFEHRYKFGNYKYARLKVSDYDEAVRLNRSISEAFDDGLPTSQILAAIKHADDKAHFKSLLGNQDNKATLSEIITFGEAHQEWFKFNRENVWNEGSHIRRADSGVREYTASYYDKPIQSVTTDMIVEPIKEYYANNTEACKKLLNNIKRIFERAQKKNRFIGNNPAIFDHLDYLPVKKASRAGEWGWMDYHKIPEFWQRLEEKKHLTAVKAMRMQILTASRVGNIVGMRWDNVQQENQIIYYPEEQMKQVSTSQQKDWICPITPFLAALLDKEGETTAKYDFVFYNEATALQHPHENTVNQYFRKMIKNEENYWKSAESRGRPVAHKFRKTFRTWAQAMGYPDAWGEMQLAHEFNAGLSNYTGEKFVEQRRQMMTVWEEYVTGRRKLEDCVYAANS